MNTSYTLIGIDVSKNELEIAWYGKRKTKTFANDASGIAALVENVQSPCLKCIALEATGGYERPLVTALHDADLPVAVVNPRQVRNYAKALGILAKTDEIDARVIARFAKDVSPRCTEKPDKNRQKRADLVARRRQLLKLRTAETNRSYQACDPDVSQSIQRVMDVLNEQLEKIDQQLEQATAEDEHACRLLQRLQAVKGIGRVVAQTLINELPELGRCSRQKIAALAGLAPYNCDSGQWQGKRRIRGGRGAVRAALYMPMLSAIQTNQVIRERYEHLLAQGKQRKVAIIACMRKMLTYLNQLAAEVENEMKTA